MDVKWAYAAMVRARVMFGGVICQIFLSGVVTNLEDFLCFLTQQPKISHVHRPRPLALDGIADDADGRGVVAVDRRGGLRVAELLEGKS